MYGNKVIFVRCYGFLYRRMKMSEMISTYHLNIGSAPTSYTEPIRAHNIPCLLYIRRGSGVLKIGDHIFPLHEGQCFFSPPRTPVSYWATDKKGWEYIWILFDGPMFREALAKTAFSAQTPVCTCTAEQCGVFEDLLSKKQSFHGGEYYDSLGKMTQLIASFIDTFPSEAQLERDGSLRAILSFIDSNLSREDLNIALLCKAMGLSRTALYEKFKKELGRSPSRYIQNKRITKAKHLLRSTSLPVGQIGYAMGYKDPLYFSRVFTKKIGLSPTSYRNWATKHKKEK